MCVAVYVCVWVLMRVSVCAWDNVAISMHQRSLQRYWEWFSIMDGLVYCCECGCLVGQA